MTEQKLEDRVNVLEKAFCSDGVQLKYRTSIPYNIASERHRGFRGFCVLDETRCPYAQQWRGTVYCNVQPKD